MALLNCIRLRTFLATSILGILGMVFKYWEFFFFTYISFAILLLFILKERESFFLEKKIVSSNKAVLITGCDTGFGNLLAKRLDSKGFHVFACCLFPDGAGAEDLRKMCSRRLQVLPLDVTKDESVTNALSLVKENLNSNVLWAVVNNAGVVKGSFFDFSSVAHFKDTLDVNVLGAVRVTKAFLPLLKESKGRVINVASACCRIPVPLICSYTMSKYAILALTECLRIEMMHWGVQVISIEPEIFRTPINEGKNLVKRFEEEMKELDKDTVDQYGTQYVNKVKEAHVRFGNYSCDNTNIVVDDMESAVREGDPHLVYKPSRNLISDFIRLGLENMPRVLYDTFFSWCIERFIGYPIVLKDSRYI